MLQIEKSWFRVQANAVCWERVFRANMPRDCSRVLLLVLASRSLDPAWRLGSRVPATSLTFVHVLGLQGNSMGKTTSWVKLTLFTCRCATVHWYHTMADYAEAGQPRLVCNTPQLRHYNSSILRRDLPWAYGFSDLHTI